MKIEGEREFRDMSDVPIEEDQDPKPYTFGEKVDQKDSSRNMLLCPTCGKENVGAPDGHTKLGELRMECGSHHQWVMDKDSVVQEVNRSFDFGKK